MTPGGADGARRGRGPGPQSRPVIRGSGKPRAWHACPGVVKLLEHGAEDRERSAENRSLAANGSAGDVVF
jgi:hypothetical protein